jgi:hypothetical protein
MLYSYCIVHDHGSAPNPFWNICTLAICKPVIRRCAEIGDWIAGTGSSAHDFQNQLVYAMKVSEVMTLKEYDFYCKKSLPKKIPVFKTTDLRLKVGDCIYDFSSGEPQLRQSVHKSENIKTDLGGINVLLSNQFYYFGSKPVPLPSYLLPIVRQGKGHKSKSNEPYREKFVDWITSFKKQKNKVIASPFGLKLHEKDRFKNYCSKIHLADDEADEKLISFS